MRTKFKIFALAALLCLGFSTSAHALDAEVKKFAVTLKNFKFKSGETLSEMKLGVEAYGKLNKAKTNVVLVAHFLAGDSHAAGKYAGSSREGWWNDLIGPGLAIDTNKYCVICTDLPAGMMVRRDTVITAGPRTRNPDTGRTFGLKFPEVEIADLCKAQREVLRQLDINHIVAVTGPSMGGMISWQWAVQYPDFVDVVIPVAGPVEFTSTEKSGFKASITAIKSDPYWFFGNYHNTWFEPNYGVAMALSGLAVANSGQAYMLPYLLPSMMSEARKYDANTYIRNLEMHANYSLGKNYGGLESALSRVLAKVVIIGFKDDDFITESRLKYARDVLKAAGAKGELVLLNGKNGHLSVLEDLDELKAPIKTALDSVAKPVKKTTTTQSGTTTK